MSKLRDKIWLWGHVSRAYNGQYKLPEDSFMSITEATNYLGIDRAFLVVYKGEPQPPFDKTSKGLVGLKEVKYSVLGDKGSPNLPRGYLDDVIIQSKKFDNITGGVFDDFVGEERYNLYTPEVLTEIKEKLHENNLDMWCVYYVNQLDEQGFLARTKCFDGVTLWSYSATRELANFEQNYQEFLKNTQGQKRMLGCYMYDFGGCKELSKEIMEMQLNRYAKAIKDGETEGIILCSNCIADLGFEAVEYTRQWIAEHGDEEV